MSALGPYLVVLVVLVLMIARSGRAQTVQPARMWVVPALGIFVLLAGLARGPVPNATAIGIFASALVLGAGVGWYRAQHIELAIDSTTGQVTSRNTMLGTILLVGFIALRIVFERLTQPAGGMGEVRHAGEHNAMLLYFADAGLIFSVAMMATRRLVIWHRASTLLAEHRAARIPPGT